MATKKAKKPRKEEKATAVVIPFPVVSRREVKAERPPAVVPRREAPASKAAPRSANSAERPTLPTAPAKWWQIGLIVSIALHLAAAAVLQAKYSYDLERAAGAAAASAEGAAVIPIEVVVTAALPSAPAPTDATAPDAVKAALTTPNESADKKAESTPPKDDAAAEIVPIAKETPQPTNEKRERKERAERSNSAAANPSPAAAARAEGRAGAGGRLETGGTANVSSYQAEVLAHLQHYRLYPAEARTRGITGMATVRFALAANGSVIAASLGKSSGAAILDEAALSMVRRASPFPPFPPRLRRAQMDFAAPIRFDLR